jgi:hypothetical protein
LTMPLTFAVAPTWACIVRVTIHRVADEPLGALQRLEVCKEGLQGETSCVEHSAHGRFAAVNMLASQGSQHGARGLTVLLLLLLLTCHVSCSLTHTCGQ